MVCVSVEKTIKPKEKSSSSQLVWTTNYEVVSPYTVDECVRQLESLREKYRFKRPPIWNVAGFYFDDLSEQDGIIQFGIKASTGKIGVHGKVNGQLLRQSDNQTLVKIEIGFTYSSVVTDILILVLASLIVLFPFGLGKLIVLLLVNVFFITLVLASCSDLKPSLYRTICETLAVPQASRPQTLPP